MHPHVDQRILATVSTAIDVTASGADVAPTHAMLVAGTTVRPNDLRPGDIVDYRGERHLVSHVEYRDGWSWPIATDDTGWAIALGPDPVVVHRAAA